ncbi:penicillin-binding protein 2 [Patescibacteria group bacterium]|nr:penicillin-binding protein 2 [Patescibacteria group bacterium]MBU4023038.1 penicillin-binding protein 2 [Patescibacteria group bacterium]
MKNARLNFVYAVILLFSAIIISRLAYLQILNGERYLAWAKGQQEIFQPISGSRGEIFLFDKDNLVLSAINKSSKYCYASPRLISDKKDVAEKLSLILEISEESLLEKIENNDSLFLLLKKDLTEEQIGQIVELDLKNIHIGEDIVRLYPNDTLASDVLGFVNQDSKGQYGVEGYWNDILIGKDGWQRIEHGPFGKFFQGDSELSAKGTDLVLTIDKNIQSQAEKLLEKFSKEFKYKSAQMIAVDPKTGRILAMADFPSFNPNNYQDYGSGDLEILQNKNIQALYEPGSVFKAVTMAAGINEGKLTPETTYIDKGYIQILDKRIDNYEDRVWGKSTMTEVLEKSINTGAVFAQSQIDNNVFTDYLKRFGVFEKTGIGLQGEVYSENKEFKKGWAINFATAAFGQGIEMTPLQVIRTYCVFANHGSMPQLYLVEGVRDGDKVQPLENRGEPRQVISKDTADQIVKMLVSVAEIGYSKPARVDGYYIAGKTGSSQISFSALGINKSGYSDQTWQTFVGFAPAFDPKFVILVKLDNPATRSANESATLIFKEMAKYILDYYQIPPDKEI